MAISTTSSTATPTPAATPTPTAASVTKNAAQSLLTSLNAGSGIDTASLVPSLVEAQFAAKTAQLTAKSKTITTQISGLASLKSAISGFSTAYAALVKGGTLTSQPTSSNTAALGVSALAGAKVSGLSSTISVNQLAAAQTIRTTAAVADRTAVIGSGSFTLSFGTATYDAAGTKMTGFTAGGGTAVTIDVTDASLDGIAAAINAKGAGITASVVTDSNGSAYLSMKGATGASQAFTMTATTDTSGKLAAYNVGPGATNTSVTAAAQNAKLTVDGIAVERASNTINNLVTGVKLQLNAVSTGPVTLGSTTPTSALSQAVSDVVETYNQVMATLTEQTDPVTGVLRADPAAKTLLSSLKALTLAPLSGDTGGGSPTTLAQIGVATNRDGTLRVDAAALSNAMLTNSSAIETMLNGSADGKTGLGAVLNAITTSATNTTIGLGASQTRYTAAQSAIADAEAKIADQSAAMTTRLTQQFSSMNARVSSYKSIQSFLTNQIAAWNKSDS